MSSSQEETTVINPVKEQDLADLPVVLTVAQVQAVLRIARGTAYELVHQAGFPTIRIGKALRIPKAGFIKWLRAAAGEGDE
jgi:excisionase family DNA binding protein